MWGRWEVKKINWLADKDMLPSILPNAQITGFGLDLMSGTAEAPIDFDSATSNIISKIVEMRHGQTGRPIIFVGHGYGNIIIGKIFTGEFQSLPGRTDLVDSTSSIAFFAAPVVSLEGLIDWAVGTLRVSRYSKLFGGQLPLPQIWEALNNSTLEKNIPTFAFLEKESLVPQTDESADAKKPAVPDGPRLNFDHNKQTEDTIGDVAKFMDPEDSDFQAFSNWMLDAVQTHQLLRAAKKGELGTMDLLIKQSFDLNLSDRLGQTALHIATKNEQVGVVRKLIQTGRVSLDSQDNEGMTALHIAVRLNTSRSAEIVEALLAASAISNLEDNNGITAQQLSDDPERLLFIQELLRMPPLIEGPSARERLVKGSPPDGDCTLACRKTGMVAREIFAAEDENPDTHLPFYSTVLDIVYGDQGVNEMFRSLHGSNVMKGAMCHWYHLPMNNVSSLETSNTILSPS
jgi:hypothetical protein